MLVIKTPLWKRVGVLLIGTAGVIGGTFLISVGQPEPLIVGIICIIFFGFGGIRILFRSRTVLIADAEGITVTLARSAPKKIPWPMIENIAVATERTLSVAPPVPMRSKHRLLAIYLRDKNFLISQSASELNQAAMKLLQESGLATLDDGGSAQIYIPAAALPGWSVEKVVEELNGIRPQAVPS